MRMEGLTSKGEISEIRRSRSLFWIIQVSPGEGGHEGGIKGRFGHKGRGRGRQRPLDSRHDRADVWRGIQRAALVEIELGHPLSVATPVRLRGCFPGTSRIPAVIHSGVSTPAGPLHGSCPYQHEGGHQNRDKSVEGNLLYHGIRPSDMVNTVILTHPNGHFQSIVYLFYVHSESRTSGTGHSFSEHIRRVHLLNPIFTGR